MATEIKRPSLVRNVLLIAGAILLIIAVVSYYKNRPASELEPSPEEIIVSQEGAVRKIGEEEQVLTDEEIKQLREEVDGIMATAGKATSLDDIGGTGASGQASYAYSDGKYYLKVMASGLPPADKGYYYEGWLRKEDHISVGRVEVNAFGEGVLYYTASIDRSDYDQVMITLEPEDGNMEPAKVVLRGEF